MGYPYDEEDQRDPLAIEEPPRPSGDIVRQGDLQEQPQTAPTPTVNVDAYARGTPPPENLQPSRGIAAEPDAYTPAQVPEPRIFHQVAANPVEEENNLVMEQQKAQKIQEQSQKQENQRVATNLKVLKSQGGMTTVDPQTGLETPKMDDEGRQLFKPAVLEPFQQKEDGSLVSVHRDRFGNEQEVPLQPKLDKDTGERYVTSADGVSRYSLGVDQDYILRRDTANLGKVASEARAEVAALGTQKKDLTSQIADYGNQAAVLATKKNPTDDDRAQLKRLQDARQNAVSQLDQINQLHDEKSQEAMAATTQWNDKRKLITDKIKQQMGLRPASSTSTSAPDDSQAPSATTPTPTPTPQQKAVASVVQHGLGIDDGLWARTKNFFGNLVGSAATGQANALSGYTSAGEAIYHVLPGSAAAGPGGQQGTLARSVISSLAKVPGVLTNPALQQKPEAKIARAIGEYGSLITSGILDPAIPIAQMVGMGYQGQHDAAKAYFDQEAAKNPNQPRDLAHEQAVADRSGVLGASINAVVAMIPIGKAAEAVKTVFGKAAAPEIAQVVKKAYDSGGAEGVANVLNELKQTMTKIGTGEGFETAAQQGLDGVIKEITRPAVSRLADVAKRGAIDAGVFGGAQVAQNLVSKTYNPQTGLFENVPSSLATGAIIGAGFGGAAEVAKARRAANAAEQIKVAMAKRTWGKEVGPEESPQADPTLVSQLRDAVTTHTTDLAREKDILQQQVNDPSEPIDGKGDKISRINEIDQEIAGLTSQPGQQPNANEPKTVPSAEHGAEPPVPAAETGGQPGNRRVPDETSSQPAVHPGPEGQAADVRPGQTPAAGNPPDLQPSADAGQRNKAELLRRIAAVPDLANTEQAEAHGKSGQADIPALMARYHELLRQAGGEEGDQKVATISKAQLYREAAGEAAKLGGTVDASAHESATSPTNTRPTPSGAQSEAENYKMGHDTIGGMPISFENPAGSIRTNLDMQRVKMYATAPRPGGGAESLARYIQDAHDKGDANAVAHFGKLLQQHHLPDIAKGAAWATKMLAHYGRFKGTVGKDGDHLDAYVKEGTPKDYKGPVFVVNQKKKDGSFDEHKAMVGYGNMSEATAEYAKHYDIPASSLIHSTVSMSWEHFKKWAREGDLTKPATGTSSDYANNKQSAAAVHVRPPSENRPREGEERAVVPETTGAEEPAAGTGRVPDEAIARAKSFVQKALIGDRVKASLDHLGVSIKNANEDDPKLRGKYAIRTGWLPGTDDAPKWAIYVDYDRLGLKTSDMTPGKASDYIAKGVEEEMLHVAQLEAVKREWTKTRDKSGWSFQQQLEAEYQQVEEAMDDNERAAVKEAYGEHGGGWQGSTLGAEFVRQLLQQKRTGRITEATIRAQSIIEKILAVLRDVWNNIKARSEALRGAIERTEAVLDEIEKAATKERAPPEAAKPETTKPEAIAAPPEKPIESGASDELKAQAKKAFEGLFAPEPQFGVKEIAITLKIQRGDSPEKVARDYAMPLAKVQQIYDRVTSSSQLGPQEHGINLGAPEPIQQVALPKDKRPVFMDLADKLEAEGITTPEKLAALINEISGGRALQYTKAVWKLMESTGAVDEKDAPTDWDAPISLATTGGGPNVSGDEPAVRPSGGNAGEPVAGEGDNAGQVQAGGAVPEQQLPAATAGPGTRQSAGGGRSQPASAGVGEGRESVAAARADDTERADSPVAGAGPGDSGGASLTGPTGRVAAGERRAGDFRINAGTVLAPSGRVAKLKANVGALKLLKQLQKENRPATPEEQAKLAQYTGWGHTKEVFNEGEAAKRGQYYENANWIKNYGAAYDQLKKLLTPEEWEQAAEGSMTAHYTAPEEIKAMWSIVQRLGFNGGRVLEPAIGVGHFFGLMPENLQGHSKLFGLDMDSISSGIAKKLYPSADIKTGKFEKAKLPNNYFDLIISNVPFHEVGPIDSRYPQLNLHNYFFARAFDLAKPGGLVVAITSNSTLDNNPDQRKYLQDKADLVTAIRLPNTAFLSNAGTEVTTDILVFRKPDGTPFKGESFLNTVQVAEDKGQPVVANEYFARHPEMAIGKHSLQGTQYRENSYALVPDKYRPLEASLQEAIQKVPENVFSHARDFYEQQQPDFGLVREGEKEGSVSFRDGRPLQVTGSEYKTPAWADKGFRSRTRDPVKRIEMAKSFVGLRDQMKQLLADELNPDASDSSLAATRGKLRQLYDQHVAKFGQLEKGNLKFLEDDPEYYLVMGLEIVDKERKGDTFEKVIKPADILSQRTLFPVTPPTHVPDVKDASMVSMQYRGKIDSPYVAELTGLPAEDAEQSIIDSGVAFKNPVSGLLQTRDAYLSSNVRQKLREAEAAAKDDPRYEKNVEELKAIQPERVGFENIRARAGSSWIPEPVYTAFTQKTLGKSAKVTYNKTLDRWSVSLGREDLFNAENKSLYGTDRATGADILGDVLNLRNPKIYDTVEDVNEQGKTVKKQVLNKPATDQAQAKALRFKQEFDTFMREDPDANKSIEDTYNDQFNSYVVPMFDGSHLVFPGMASVYKGRPLKLRSNQKDGIYRVTQTGGTLLAHGVGAGKTITIIASAMEMRRLGLARKPLIVVDKPTTGQFAQTFRQVYPNANVLVATEDSFTAANRKRFMSRIATGNWDAVVMSNSQFDLMPNDPAVIQQYVQTQIDQLKEVAAEVESDEGKGTPKVRQTRTEIKRLENRLGKLLERLGARQDDTIYFEQSGVDALFVDEVHAYKKVPFVTKMDPVKGIDRQSSQRAIALHAKVQFIHENNRNRNVITATGTPVTNTLAEAWNMTRLVAPKLLEEWGVDTFDKFVSTFAEVVNSTEINAANQWVSVERLSKFTNGPELVKMIRSAWDVRMGEDLKDLKLPSIKGGKPQLVSLEVTPEQLQITQFLQSVYKQFQGMDAKKRREYSWIPIVTMSTGMAASVDPRLVNTSLPDNPNSVINEAARNIARIFHETTAKRSTQIVFLDRYRPMNTEKIRLFAAGSPVSIGDEAEADEALKDQSARLTMDPHDNAFSEAELNLYDDLRNKLVAAGVPREEIAIANEHDSDAKRLRMQEDMQTGRIRLLIGSTQKIGQGINVSDKLYAAHHLDPPIQMTPAQYIQRNGRIIRDPNENTEVQMLNYGMKRTLAAGIWDRINTKAKFIIQVLMGRGVGRDFEDPADEITMSIAEQVAELTGDRRVLRKVELESEVRSLQAAREAHYNNVGSARRKLRETQEQLDRYDKDLIPAAITDKELLETDFGPDGKNFSAKVREKTFTDPKEYDATIKDLVQTGQDKATAHFEGAGKKDYSIHYDAHQEINGVRAETQLRYTNPVRGGLGSEHSEIYTAFSTPNTKGVSSTNAKTGAGILQAAKKLWADRDQRIEQLKEASQNTRAQIPKLEAEANKTFTQEKELEAKSAELNTLTRELLGTDAPTGEASGGSLTDEAPDRIAIDDPEAARLRQLDNRLEAQSLYDQGRTIYSVSEQGGDAVRMKSPGDFQKHDPSELYVLDPEQPGLGAPEPTAPAPDPTQGALKSAFAELPAKEKKVLAMRLQNKSDAEISKATGLPPVGVETAYQIAIAKMQKARDAAADIRGTMRQVVAEKPGQRTMGRPGLANPAAGELSRKLVDTVDEIRKQSGVPGRRKDKDVIAEARARLTKDYAGERKRLIEMAGNGQMLDDTETVMAKRIVAREALRTVRFGKDEQVLETAKLIDAYRMTGTIQARALRQRFDNSLSPEERASEYIAESLLTPDIGRRNRLDRLAQDVVDLEQQLEEARSKAADPMQLKKLLDARDRKLKEREAIIANWTRKIEGVKKKLAALGIDLENMSDDEISNALKDRTKARSAMKAIQIAKADNWDALYEYWVNGLLSSPTTLGVKMLSDVAHALLDFGPQRWIEAAVNMMTPGDKSTSPHFGELPYVYKAIFPALSRAFSNVLKSWRTESPAFEGEFSGSEFNRPKAIGGMKGEVIRVPTRNIMAADDAAASALATMQVQAEAYRIAAVTEGLTGDALAQRMIELTTLNSGDPNDAWVAARDHAAVLRFQNELGAFGKWIQRGKANVPGIRYVIPFPLTMSNIFKAATRKTPLGTPRLFYKLAREGMVKMDWDGSDYHYERKHLVRDVAEQILAWAVVFSLLGLTRKRDEDDGLPVMTGSTAYSAGNKGLRDLAMRTAPPTSIKIGDRWHNYSRIEPWGVMLVTMVDMINDTRQVKEGGDVSQTIGKLLNQSLTQVKDKTFARGIGDLLNAFQDGEHATEWAGNFSTTWVPFSSLVKAAARNSDEAIREQKVWGREEWTQNLIDSLKYRALPIASDVIQPKVDLWGRDIQRDQGVSPATDWLYRMTVPVNTVKIDKPLQIDRLILNWNNSHPEEIFSPSPPPPVWTKKIDGKEQHIYMDREEYHNFLQASGQAALGRLSIQSLNVENPTRENVQAINKALEESRKQAREALWQQRIAKAAGR